MTTREVGRKLKKSPIKSGFPIPIDDYSNSCSFEESQLPITNYRIIYSGRFRERSKFLSLFIADSQP
jgi:hypothetical protein